MRILVVHPGPNWSVADVHNGLVKGLEQCGQDVRSFNLDDRLNVFAAGQVQDADGAWHRMFNDDDAARLAAYTLKAELYGWWPDVVIFTSGFFIPPDMWGLLTYRPHHTVLWCTESPYEDERQLGVARYVDTVILNDPVNIQAFRAINPRTWYFPHSYDPDIHHPGDPVPHWVCDFGWVGTGFQSRIDFFTHVDWRGVDVRLAGNWKLLRKNSRLRRYLLHDNPEACFDNADTVRLYRSSKLSANVYRKEFIGTDIGIGAPWAAGPREIELAAVGCFMLREPRGEGDALFPHAPTFTEPGEFGDLVRYWAGHDEAREKIADENREAIADRTFQTTARRLLGLIEAAPKRHYLGATHGTQSRA